MIFHDDDDSYEDDFYPCSLGSTQLNRATFDSQAPSAY